MIEKTTFHVYDTTVEISAWVNRESHGGKRDVCELLNQAQALCERYEKLFSRTLPESDVSKINNAAGKPVAVHAEVAELVECALAYREASDGLFDITLGSITPLWNYKDKTVPDAKRVESCLPSDAPRDVSVTYDAPGGPYVQLSHPLVKIDLGGIAKGYIADKIGEYLFSQDVGGGIVNLGGNILAVGEKADGNPWTIGIRDPFNLDSLAFVTKGRDYSAVTSGIYERAFSSGGKFYHHIIDPHTLKPSTSDIASVTVLSERSIDGDGYSTGLFVMGSKQALARAEEIPGIELVVVDRSGRCYASSGAERYGLRFVGKSPLAYAQPPSGLV